MAISSFPSISVTWGQALLLALGLPVLFLQTHGSVMAGVIDASKPPAYCDSKGKTLNTPYTPSISLPEDRRRNQPAHAAPPGWACRHITRSPWWFEDCILEGMAFKGFLPRSGHSTRRA